MTTPLKAVAAGGNSAELREWVAGDFLPVANGGTGGTTAVTARSSLGLGAAAVAAILGTVSQSGGVPTGAIMQSGSNANGEFLRLADGRQICHKSLSVTGAVATAFGSAFVGSLIDLGSFPAAFIAAPEISVTVSGGSGGSSAIGSSSTATAGAAGQWYAQNMVSRASSTYVFSYIAVGRWF